MKKGLTWGSARNTAEPSMRRCCYGSTCRRVTSSDHSFWVPRLAGKTDLIPNHPNSMWVDPHEKGLYLGQCAQYCGTQHAKMLLRVYVQTRDEFDRWIQNQRQAAQPGETVS